MVTDMSTTRKTVQGEAWDQIAKTEWGDEKLMHHLLEANPDLMDVVLFSGNDTIVIPEVSTEEIVGLNLPPWKL